VTWLATATIALVLGLLVPLRPAAAQAVRPSADSVRRLMQTRAAQLPGAEIGVAIHDLASGRRLELNGDVVFHAASTMKVPVLIDLLREVDAGRLRLDQPLLLVNAYHSIVDGSPYQLDATDDSDSLVFARVGEFVPIRWLAQRMITHSSNLATNALIAILDPARTTRTMTGFGARHTLVLRGVEDGVAYRAGRNNVTSANDLAAILTALERGAAASPASTQVMREFLLQQVFREQIPAGLPPDTKVAHKTGWITATQHDAAIVYPPDRAPFVLVVLTRGITDRKAANALIADIAEITWSWLTPGPG
jgi:beta-lactamase class A